MTLFAPAFGVTVTAVEPADAVVPLAFTVKVSLPVASVVLTTLAILVPATTSSCEPDDDAATALIASWMLFLPVSPILVMVMLPSELSFALPPKLFLVLLATLPNAPSVAYN